MIVWLPLTILIAWKRLRTPGRFASYRALVGAVWLGLAVLLDYIILVKGFGAAGYYDLDIALYYALSFLTPFLIGFGKPSVSA